MQIQEKHVEDNQSITTESNNVEIKECENISMRSRRASTQKGVERLKMKYKGNKYGTQLTSTGNRKDQEFMHNMH